LPEALVVVSGDGKVAIWNRAAEGLLGWPQDLAIGRDVFDLLFAGASPNQERARFEELFRARESDIQAVCLRRDGFRVHVQARVGTARLTGGEEAVALSLRDVTLAEYEEKAAALEAKLGAQEYRSLFEGALEGIYRSTLDGRFLSANRAVA